MERMRILHVLPTLSRAYGGLVRSALALDKFCSEQEIGSFVYPPWGAWRGGRCLAHFPGPLQLISLFRKVKTSDIIMAHGLWALGTTSACLLARYHSKPYIVNLHGMLDRWSLQQSRWKKQLYGALFERRVLRRASGLRFLNDEELEEARDYGLEAPVFVVPNGVDVSEFRKLPSRNDPRNAFHQLEGQTVVLFMGRLHPKKGLALLIAALAKARKVQRDLHLVLAGPDEGGYLRKIRRLIADYSLERSVTLTGMLAGETKRQVLGAADLFALPSYQEGDSIAVKEAMAAGLPVVITRACHVPEVAEKRAGVIIEHDAEQLADALVVLGGNRDLRRSMGENGRILIAEKYSSQFVAGQIIEICKDILRGECSSAAWRMK